MYVIYKSYVGCTHQGISTRSTMFMSNSIYPIIQYFPCCTNYYLTPGGGCEVLFSHGLCVCLSVCPADILVFYFSAIRRDMDLNTYRVVLNSLNKIDLQRSRSQGRYIVF